MTTPPLRRPLTPNELMVLAEIQDMYGPQNSPDQVSFSDSDEAVLFVVDRNGAAGMAVVLTNLGDWLADGTIASVRDLREHWLAPT